jgi:hypothetical protein
MPLPTNKIELLDNLKQAYQKLDSELDSVDSRSERLKQIDGDISCCDVLAYQIGWGHLLLGWEQQEANGSIPTIPAEGFKWSQQKELAQSFYQANSDKTLDQLREEFSECYDAIVAWIDSLTDEELFIPKQRNWTGEKWAIVKWIQVNTIAPYRSARTKVRRWKKSIVIDN